MKEFFIELRDFSYWFSILSIKILCMPIEKLSKYCRSEREELLLFGVYAGAMYILLSVVPTFLFISISVIYFYAMLMIAIRICEYLWYSIKS